MALTKSTGPECPYCGCAQSEELAQKQWFGRVLSIRSCGNCHAQFNAEQPGAEDGLEVPAPEIPRHQRGPVAMTYESNPVRCRCPECGEENPRVTKSIPKGNSIVRYHLCAKGHHSKSVEKQ